MDKKQPVKPTHVYGRSVYRPTKSTILVCACGNRYIKTRERQNACLRCFIQGRKK